MIVPGSLNASFFGRSVGHAVVSIATPLNGSNIVGNSTSEAITGTASSNAGNITSVQYQIDSGTFQTISITPAPTVNYSGGNAGGQGVGNHTVTVKVTDASSNTAQVSSSYSISSGSTSPSYSWTPAHTPNGANNYLVIQNSTHNATVQFSQNQFNAQGQVIATTGLTTLGTTDNNGNFNYTGTASWATGAWSDSVALYVGGVNVANFTFYSNSVGPTISYGPSTAPTSATLSIAVSYPTSVVAQTVTYSPSGRTVGPVAIGATDSAGNFSYSYNFVWNADTSASISVTLSGVGQGTFPFVP